MKGYNTFTFNFRNGKSSNIVHRRGGYSLPLFAIEATVANDFDNDLNESLANDIDYTGVVIFNDDDIVFIMAIAEFKTDGVDAGIYVATERWSLINCPLEVIPESGIIEVLGECFPNESELTIITFENSLLSRSEGVVVGDSEMDTRVLPLNKNDGNTSLLEHLGNTVH